jgi:Lyzozyme M1 (1,4-beta-N-acetylmuramidase)
MKGIDIYEGDNIQDWNIVKQQGTEVVIHKATQGTNHLDSLLQYRYPKIKEAELKIGFYHFANNTGDPEAQAQYFLNAIEGLESDAILFLDIEAEENWDKQAAINFSNAFISYIQSKNFQIGIYTGVSFYTDYLEGNIPDVPLWIASYGNQPSLYPDKASWQYSESGELSGIVGNVDLDYFIDNILLKKGEEYELKNIVGFNNQVDKRAAEYLADFLNCPTVDLTTTVNPVDYSKVENIYFVGGGDFPQITNSKTIKGNDRYDTVIEVLKNIGKLK